MPSEYLQIRKIESAEGKGHGYQAAFYAVNKTTGKVTFKVRQKIAISTTQTRLRSDANTWEVQEDGGFGWRELTPETVAELNSEQLNQLYKA